MPHRVAYLTRDDRGGRLRAVRFVTEHSDDQWEGLRFDAREAVPAAEEAAEWILNRCASHDTRFLDTLCLDPDGAACSWLTVTSTDSASVRAVLETQGMADQDDDSFGLDAGLESLSGRFPDLPGELSVEALPMNAGGAGGGGGAALATRTPVLAIPDATVRLLLDALDRRGVRVGSVCSLWHAAARVWDPSSPWGERGGARGDRVVATDNPVTAVVLIDPLAERLIWSWSSSGNLVAAGSMRVRTAVDRDVQRLGLETVGEIERRAVLTDAEIGRLTQDWLSWSAQIGIAPSRVVCVGSPAAIGGDGMSPPRVGEAIAARWPETTVDLIDEPDAVGATLKRLASPGSRAIATEGSPHAELVNLTRRPGSTHRSMYRWAGVSLVLAGIGLSLIAGSLYRRAGLYRDEQPKIDAQIQSILTEVDPALAADAFPVRRLEERISRARSSMTPANTTPPAPVLEAFDTLSLVLGTPGIMLVSLDINSHIVKFQLHTPDLLTAETLATSLQNIEGLPINWSTPRFNENRGMETIQANYSGNWALPTTQGGGS